MNATMHRPDQRISIIVAMAENRAIGIENRLPWSLPADLRRFRSLTMGHHMLMGRKTFESIGKPLPGRTSVIITRQPDFSAPDCIVANAPDAAIAACGDDPEIFVIGGADLYRQALNFANRIYLTLVHAQIDGDAFFPALPDAEWEEIGREKFGRDEKHAYDYDFIVYDKINNHGEQT